MVRVVIERSQADRTIRAYSVEGHADFAESGKDIVCAGVSAITVGTVNAIETLLGVGLEARMRKGLLKVNIPGDDSGHGEKLQMLLEAMIVMLQTIEKSYDKHLNIREILK